MFAFAFAISGAGFAEAQADTLTLPTITVHSLDHTYSSFGGFTSVGDFASTSQALGAITQLPFAADLSTVTQIDLRFEAGPGKLFSIDPGALGAYFGASTVWIAHNDSATVNESSTIVFEDGEGTPPVPNSIYNAVGNGGGFLQSSNYYVITGAYTFRAFTVSFPVTHAVSAGVKTYLGTDATFGASSSSFFGPPLADYTVMQIIDAPPVVETHYLAGSGSNLVLDAAAPNATTAEFTDSTAVKFAQGNVWKLNGEWSGEATGLQRTLADLGDLHVWLGLKNSDDQGTRFDVRAEVLKNGVTIASGELRCVTGVTRNPANALEVAIPFGLISDDALGPTDAISVRVYARIGTTPTGTFCGGHSNAVGLRLYFDAVTRPARFDVATLN